MLFEPRAAVYFGNLSKNQFMTLRPRTAMKIQKLRLEKLIPRISSRNKAWFSLFSLNYETFWRFGLISSDLR